MAKKECRVCGKMYDACNTRNVTDMFRWQDVSCSPECGAKYLHEVLVSRGEIVERSVVENIDDEDDDYDFDNDNDEDDLIDSNTDDSEE